MSEQGLAGRLSATDLACLRYLSYYPDAELFQFDERVVGRLLAEGLVERVLQLAYPVLPQRYRYRLTSKGRSVLNAASHP